MYYTELVKSLRDTDFSDGCPCGAEPLCKDKDCVIWQAADAIEELQRDVNFHKFNSEFWEDKYNSLADEKWIPLTEQLPVDGKYLVLYANGNIDIDEYMTFSSEVGKRLHPNGKWYCEFDDWGRITHWMPLPEPQKEET